MKNKTTFDERFADLLLQARGIEAVRGILARRGASSEEIDAHTLALQNVQHQLAKQLVA